MSLDAERLSGCKADCKLMLLLLVVLLLLLTADRRDGSDRR